MTRGFEVDIVDTLSTSLARDFLADFRGTQGRFGAEVDSGKNKKELPRSKFQVWMLDEFKERAALLHKAAL